MIIILILILSGEAVLLEGVQGKADNNAMLQTLQTKVHFSLKLEIHYFHNVK